MVDGGVGCFSLSLQMADGAGRGSMFPPKEIRVLCFCTSQGEERIRAHEEKNSRR
jgi:hypothetical protein